MAGTYIPRRIEAVVKAAARQFPAVIVTGPRQSGKTTLLTRLFAKRYAYVSMDNPDLRLLAAREPELFFASHKPPIIIDEIQYAPELFSYIKIIIDKDRDRNGRFLLTGSQLFPLMANAGESLAGRIAILTLLPFSLSECLPASERPDLEKLKIIALRGGFPELTVKKEMKTELWFASYLQSYLERDVRQLRQIGDLSDFQRFLQLMAAFNGQVLNLSGLSRDLGVAVNTVKAWISILEASGQLISIKPFYLNKGKRIIKSPKIYFLDTGLLCYLAGISSREQVFKGPLSGSLFETLVLGEVMKSFYNKGKVPRIFWWRTSYGEEVDFVIEERGRIIPLEIKLTSRADERMAKGLISFCGLFKDRVDRAFLVNLSQIEANLGRKVKSAPFAEFARLLPKLI